MYVVAYYVVFAMRSKSTMVDSKNKSDIVLLFYIAMHDLTIYLSFFYHHVSRPTCIDIKDRSHAFSFWIYFFQIWDTALNLNIMKFHCNFRYWNQKDFKIFPLSEMTEHEKTCSKLLCTEA